MISVVSIYELRPFNIRIMNGRYFFLHRIVILASFYVYCFEHWVRSAFYSLFILNECYLKASIWCIVYIIFY